MTKFVENPYLKGTFMTPELFRSQFTLIVDIEYLSGYDGYLDGECWTASETVEIAKAGTLLELYYCESKLYAESCLPKSVLCGGAYRGEAKVVRAKIQDRFGKSVLMKLNDGWVKPATTTFQASEVKKQIKMLNDQARYERGMCDNYATAKTLNEQAEMLGYSLVDSLVTTTKFYHKELNEILC